MNDESAADNAVPTGVGKSHESAWKVVSFPRKEYSALLGTSRRNYAS